MDVVLAAELAQPTLPTGDSLCHVREAFGESHLDHIWGITHRNIPALPLGQRDVVGALVTARGSKVIMANRIKGDYWAEFGQ